MGLKGYRLWVIGQLDSNVQSPTTVNQGPSASQPEPEPSCGFAVCRTDTPAAVL
jgi:hypothetical protein